MEQKEVRLTSLNEVLDREIGMPESAFRKHFEKECEAFYLSECLREERKKAGLTQQQLAEKIGTKRTYISRLENGHCDIQLSTLYKIFNGLGRHISIVVS